MDHRMSIDAQSTDSRVGANGWYPFTRDEKDAIKKAWATIEPVKQQVACDIYEMIFNQCPEARRLFPKMKFKADKSEKKSTEFIFQALRFMQVIEGAVMAIEHPETLNPILDNLGRRHGKLEVNGKFRAYYWAVFLECSIFHMRKGLEANKKFPSKEVDTAVILFRFLVRDVIKKIKIGYNCDIEHRMSQMSVADSRKISLPHIKKYSINGEYNPLDDDD